MDTSIIAIKTDVIRNGKNVIGYGFSSHGRYAPSGLLRDRFIPRLLKANSEQILNDDKTNFDPFKIWDILMTNEKPGGHGERSVAVGAIDMAVWDLVSKIEEKPLYQYLSEKYNNGKIDDKVFVYAAGGYYSPEFDIDQLKEEIKGYLDQGYNKVKIKIGGASLEHDLKRIEAVLSILPNEEESLAVDANARFSLEEAIEYGKRLKEYNLFWYEEPGDPLDYSLLKELIAEYSNPVATGENLFSFQDAKNLILYGGLRPDKDFLQFDCALSYGLVEYLRILQMLKENGWSWRRCIPHGGHQMSLNIAAGLGLGGNESYPGIFEPFGGFADESKVIDGYIELPDAPGIGFEEKSDLYQLFKSL